jgi:hypothetical protein
VQNSHQPSYSEFQSDVLVALFALLLMQISVAVLMAVRYQLSCFLLRDIATNSTSHLIVDKWLMRHPALGCNFL